MKTKSSKQSKKETPRVSSFSIQEKKTPPKKLLMGLAILLGLGVAAFTGLRLLQATSGLGARKLLDPLPQDPYIKVYMNHSGAAEYKEPYRKIARLGDDFEQIIVDTIGQANTSVELAVQEFRLPLVAQALADRQRSGVQVRVVIENTYNNSLAKFSPVEVEKMDERERERYDEALQLIDINGDGRASDKELEERDALIILQKAGVPYIDDTADGSAGSGLMHHKFLVVDGRTVLTTSANFTTSDVHGDALAPETRGNSNNMLVIDSLPLASLFTEEFNLMWGDGPGGKEDSQFGLKKKPFRLPRTLSVGSTRLQVTFSPISESEPWENSTNGLIAKTLGTAKQTINLALFVFTEQKIVDVMENRHNQGVQPRVLIDRSFAYRDYSEGLDMQGVTLLKKNCKAEEGNRPWSNPVDTVGVPNIPSSDKLHHKYGVVDGHTVITGSHNWSAAANHLNDETLLVIYNNPTVAAHYEREFDQLFGDAFLGLSESTQRKISERQQSCG